MDENERAARAEVPEQPSSKVDYDEAGTRLVLAWFAGVLLLVVVLAVLATER